MHIQSEFAGLSACARETLGLTFRTKLNVSSRLGSPLPHLRLVRQLLSLVTMFNALHCSRFYELNNKLMVIVP